MTGSSSGYLARLGRPICLIGALFVGGQALLLLTFRLRTPWLVDAVRFCNKLLLNPAMLLVAGRRHWYASVIVHVGRRSGRHYETPLVAEPTIDGFLLPLPYGARVDWCRNVLAAGGCLIKKDGVTYSLNRARLIDRSAGLPMLPAARQLLFRLYGVRQFLSLTEISQPREVEATRRGQECITKRRKSTVVVGLDALRAARSGPAAVLDRQRSRLAEMVAFARLHSPFYRHLYRGLDACIADLRQLPPVNKRELMAHFDDWVTDPAVTKARVEAFAADLSKVGQMFLGSYLIWTTSGSTGVPALLVQDQDSLSVIQAMRFRALPMWMRLGDIRAILRLGYRVAVLVATGGHFGGASLAEWLLRSHASLRKRVRIFSVQTPLNELVNELNAFQPSMISGYATALALLAFEQEAGRLHISPVFAVSTAESLAPTMRRRIQAALGCRLRDAYGASEAGAIAFECDQGWLHVNADWCILEPVDERYRPVAAGNLSRTVLVTNLANRVQPLIRYDLGDSVTLKRDSCSCGSALAAVRVEGRTDEILRFSAAAGETVYLLPLALGTVIEETPGVRSFQAIQTGPASLLVRLEVISPSERDVVWQNVKQRLRAYLDLQDLREVVVELGTEPPARNPRTGKFRHVWAEPQAAA